MLMGRVVETLSVRNSGERIDTLLCAISHSQSPNRREPLHQFRLPNSPPSCLFRKVRFTRGTGVQHFKRTVVANIQRNQMNPCQLGSGIKDRIFGCKVFECAMNRAQWRFWRIFALRAPSWLLLGYSAPPCRAADLPAAGGGVTTATNLRIMPSGLLST